MGGAQHLRRAPVRDDDRLQLGDRAVGDVVLVAGAEPSMRWRTFCTLLLDAAAALGVTRVVTLGSLLADVVHSHPVRITGMASDPSFVAVTGKPLQTPRRKGDVTAEPVMPKLGG